MFYWQQKNISETSFEVLVFLNGTLLLVGPQIIKKDWKFCGLSESENGQI